MEKRVDESVEKTKVYETKGEDLSRLSPKNKRRSWKEAMMRAPPRKRPSLGAGAGRVKRRGDEEEVWIRMKI